MAIFDQIARLLDPVSFFLVFGGAFAVAALRASREELGRAFAALGPLFSARPDADAVTALRAVSAIERVAQARSIASADRVKTAGVFLRRATFQLSEARVPGDFALWGDDEIEGRRARHAGAIAFWRGVADVAPAMGMIGTIIGLVQMFAHMEDATAIGPAMALALLTTLYGVLLSSLIAGPVAARLERLSEAETAWQRRAVDRLVRLAEAELAGGAVPARPPLRTVS
jgi:chemotaxis protein MotA